MSSFIPVKIIVQGQIKTRLINTVNVTWIEKGFKSGSLIHFVGGTSISCLNPIESFSGLLGDSDRDTFLDPDLNGESVQALSSVSQLLSGRGRRDHVVESLDGSEV